MILLMMAPPLEGCYDVVHAYHRHSPSSAGGHWTFPAAATSTSEIDGLTIQKINPDIIFYLSFVGTNCRSDSQQQEVTRTKDSSDRWIRQRRKGGKIFFFALFFF